MDFAVATWVTCLAGKKTFWFRNPFGNDQIVWEYQDVDIDHQFCSEPWAQTDLYPGTTLWVIFSYWVILELIRLEYSLLVLSTQYNKEDSIFCGGHFLTSSIMYRFLKVLCQTEMDPNLTNTSKAVDFFYILENFMLETLSPSSHNLTKTQLYWLIIELKEYLQLTPSNHTKDQQEYSHLKRRKTLTIKVEKGHRISRLEGTISNMTW